MKTSLLSAFATTALGAELLLPLYQFPANNGGVWKPIEDALTKNPSVTAKIVINPHNGPGGPGEGIDDGQYKAGGQALSQLSNAQLLGYVHTSTDYGATRCNRPLTELEADIRKWATWVAQGVKIRGIFVDEAPQNSANDCVNYMTDLVNFIRTDKNVTAAFGAKPLLVFNPGGVGSSTGALQPFYNLNPDYIIAIETCFVVPPLAGGDPGWDNCPLNGNYATYDNAGVGSTITNVLLPNIQNNKTNIAHTAVLVHGFHDYNGGSANLTASADVLQQMIKSVVKAGIGATFFNQAGYSAFTNASASIDVVVGDIAAANLSGGK